MRKLLGVVFCLVLCLTFVGCSSGDKADNRIKIACIVKNEVYDNFSKYQKHLEPYGFSLTLVTDKNVTNTDFSRYKLIIIGKYDNYISQESANTIYQSGRPVLGIGYYGLNYFKKVPNAANEYPNLYSATTAYSISGLVSANDPDNIIWTYPNKIDTNNAISLSCDSIYAVHKQNTNNFSLGYTTYAGDTITIPNADS